MDKIPDSNGNPIVIREYKKKWLFGLISIEYHVENRRPDLSDDECNDIRVGKYKHFLFIRIFGSRYDWTFRTRHEYEELPYINGMGRRREQENKEGILR